METKNVGRPNAAVGVTSGKVSENKAAEKGQSKDGAKQTRGKGKGFDVNLSSQAKNIAESRAKALEIAKNTPDVRMDKVASIKEQIANGTYKVDSGRIADGMLREAIMEKLAENE